MLTPQAIKDQEFQIKFRGYDAIEVRSYLELLAEDYFELHEQNRVQAEEIESLTSEQETWREEKEKLENELRENQESNEAIQAEIQEGYKHKDEEIDRLKARVEELEGTVATLESEKSEAAEKIVKLEEEIGARSESFAEEKEEIERLRARLEQLEEKNRELQQEGLDFKTTILAAQKFADNLKMTSEQEAEALMEQARVDVAKFRKEAQAELAHLPKEIEELQQKKIQVRDELKAVLNTYLQKLDSFGETDDDFSDLFQSIQIPEVESVDPDDIDNIDMELP